MFQGDTMGTVLIQVVERPWIQESMAKNLPMLFKKPKNISLEQEIQGIFANCRGINWDPN